MLEDVAKWDINWCGAEFKIERAEFTCLPEDPTDEAMLSIESIVTYPAHNRARVRCHLKQPFRLFLQVRGNTISLTQGIGRVCRVGRRTSWASCSA